MKVKNAVLVVMFSVSLIAQTPSGQFGFQDLRVGMSLAGFKAKHSAPRDLGNGLHPLALSGQSSCSAGAGGKQASNPEGVIRCDYQEALGNEHVKVSAMFLDGKLAVIEVEPPYDSWSCFVAQPPEICRPYADLRQELIGKIGPATQLSPPNPVNGDVVASRWENGSSVAEFQIHLCGPWNGRDDGWAQAILELLTGSFCSVGKDSISYRQAAMFYVDKALGPALAARLAKS